EPDGARARREPQVDPCGAPSARRGPRAAAFDELPEPAARFRSRAPRRGRRPRRRRRLHRPGSAARGKRRAALGARAAGDRAGGGAGAGRGSRRLARGAARLSRAHCLRRTETPSCRAVMKTLTIAARFCGPPGSSNGGYFAGLVATLASETVAVRLLKPPPLDTELTVDELEGGGWRVMQATEPIGEARPARLELAAKPAPDYLEAVEASRR